MSTLTRALGKAMLKSLNTYECLYGQVDRAAEKKSGSHEGLRKKLDESYINLYSDWKFYKDDTGLNEADFNKVNSDTNKPDIIHNDQWFQDLQEKYFNLCDKSDEALELPGDSTNDNAEQITESKVLETETKKKEEQEKVKSDLLLSQIEAESEAIKAAVNKLEADVRDVSSGTLNATKALSMKVCAKELGDRMNVGLKS